jgi:hypothetical protein
VTVAFAAASCNWAFRSSFSLLFLSNAEKKIKITYIIMFGSVGEEKERII